MVRELIARLGLQFSLILKGLRLDPSDAFPRLTCLQFSLILKGLRLRAFLYFHARIASAVFPDIEGIETSCQALAQGVSWSAVFPDIEGIETQSKYRKTWQQLVCSFPCYRRD